MQITHLLADSALGLIGGYIGTKVMEPVAMIVYAMVCGPTTSYMLERSNRSSNC
jgi:hypothetical protein